jgi:hypothetical protein
MITGYDIALPSRKEEKREGSIEDKNSGYTPRKRHSSELFPPYVPGRSCDNTQLSWWLSFSGMFICNPYFVKSRGISQKISGSESSGRET